MRTVKHCTGALARLSCALTFTLAGCGGSPALAPTLPVKDVIIIIQENRAVDDLFNGFPLRVRCRAA